VGYGQHVGVSLACSTEVVPAALFAGSAASAITNAGSNSNCTVGRPETIQFCCRLSGKVPGAPPRCFCNWP